MEYGPFRLIDKILAYRQGQSILTLCDLGCREELLSRYGFHSILIEAAAQSCGLMTRLEEEESRDCFLGKVKRFSLHAKLSSPLELRISAEKILSGKSLSQYRGELGSADGRLLADFDLLICSAEPLGGGSELRSEYWRRYLDSLLNSFLHWKVKP